MKIYPLFSLFSSSITLCFISSFLCVWLLLKFNYSCCLLLSLKIELKLFSVVLDAILSYVESSSLFIMLKFCYFPSNSIFSIGSIILLATITSKLDYSITIGTFSFCIKALLSFATHYLKTIKSIYITLYTTKTMLIAMDKSMIDTTKMPNDYF